MFCLAKLFLLLQPLLHLSYQNHVKHVTFVFSTTLRGHEKERKKKKEKRTVASFLLFYSKYCSSDYGLLTRFESNRTNSEVHVSLHELIENQTSVDVFFSLIFFIFLFFFFFGIIWIKDNLRVESWWLVRGEWSIKFIIFYWDLEIEFIRLVLFFSLSC